MKLTQIQYSLRRYISRVAIFIFVTLGGLTTIKSQNLLTESFNYPSGTLLTNANWLQIAAGSPNATVTSGNLAYTGTIADGFGNKVSLTATGQDVYRTFTGTAPSIYASAIVNVSAAQSTGDFFFSLGNTNVSVARLYIRSSGAGFNFGVLRSAGTVEYESTVRPFNTNIRVVLKYEQVSGATNDIVKLYVNPSIVTEPGSANVSHTGGAADVASLAAVQLYQGEAANAPTVDVDGITVGTTWASLTSAIYDHGDTPTTFDTTKDAVYSPASHTLLTGLSLGSIAPDLELTPNSVSAGADNNGLNGDGADEDAIVVSANQIRKGAAYSLSVPVTNPATSTKYLMAWIDFNGNGKFEAGEASNNGNFLTFTTTGSTTQTLNWTGLQTANIPAGTTKLYIRVRLSDRSLIDFTTPGSGGADIDERSIGFGATSTSNVLEFATASNGEVEDYQIEVVNTFDYGDVPSSYEQDIANSPLPAVHAPLTGFTIGTLHDVEANPASVTSPNQNNAAGDNAVGLADEDGLTELVSVSRGLAYTITVPVNIPSTMTDRAKYLYGWLDLNGDGRFQVGEGVVASTIAAGTTGTVNSTLTWTAANTTSIPSGTTKIYLRLRLSDVSFFDTTATAIDERSIGNGATSTTNSANATAIAFGEVEDYQLSVDLYDFGDVPAVYENDNLGVARPAAHIALAGLSLGSIVPDIEQGPYSVVAGADNNGLNGDGTDEDAITVSATQIRKGAAYSLSVPVTNTTGNKYLYGWVDFDNDGKFELSEIAPMITVTTAGSSTQTLNWSTTQTATIPAGVTKLYMRLRLSATQLIDASDATLDERSIGFGAATTGNPANFGNASAGEVEDYQIDVVNTFDYGDAPSSYEQDITNASLPAVHAPLTGFTIGTLHDVETNPASVTSPNQNNTAGDNAVGLADEDGLTELVSVSRGLAYSITVPVNIPSTMSGTKYLYGWLDLNGDGRFQLGEVATATTTATTATNLTLAWTAANTTSIALGTTKIYLRLRLSDINLADFSAGANNAAIDERSIGNGAAATNNSTNASAVAFGEVEDYQLPVDLYDFGDAPASYDNDNAGVARPAGHIALAGLALGSIVPDIEQGPHSVTAGADNNGLNGDGADEDAIVVSANQIRKGAAYSLSVPVINPATSTKYLMAWIDFNGNGKFESGEASNIGNFVTFTTTGSTSQTLNWTGTQTANIAAGTTKLYMRVRLSDRSLIDYTTGSGATDIDERSIGFGAAATNNIANFASASNGEVEDYQIDVVNTFDYGDVPSTFEQDNSNAPLPAAHAPLTGFSIGTLLDTEASPASVTSPNQNNTTGDNAIGLADEDGLSSFVNVSRGAAYSLTVPVSIPSSLAGTKYVFGWLDLNGDGRFQLGEVATTTTTATTNTNVTLTWTAANTATIPLGLNNIYLRLRLSDVNLVDATTTTIDDRSIGNGATATNNSANAAIVPFGEVEDYQLPIESYDYGDVPVSYENNKDGGYAPAAHTQLNGLSLGSIAPDLELAPHSVSAGADNNGLNGDGADEDAIVVSANQIRRGAAYSLSVPVTSTTGNKYLVGWIDLNGNGKFEAGESSNLATFNVAGSSTQLLTWSATQIASISNATNKIYMRLRLSDRALIDFTTAASGGADIDERSIGFGAASASSAVNFASPSNGEVEDYQIDIVNTYDYGDVPSTFELNIGNAPLPALHAPLTGFAIGTLLDTEALPASVTSPNQNNTAGDNAVGLADEDGISTFANISRGVAYSLTVPVTVPTTMTSGIKYLYGWLDLNGDGRFQLGEVATATIPAATTGNVNSTLTWTAANTATIALGRNNIYLRLRLSDIVLNDFSTGTDNGLIDERSIGSGAATTSASTNATVIPFGEVEDYQLPIESYDYGDVPALYENDNLGAARPAAHTQLAGLSLGSIAPDLELAPHSVAAGADNNGLNGDGADEDAIVVSANQIRKGAAYTLSVPVNNPSATSKYLIGWIDFNGNGKFESGEASNASALVTFTTTGSSTQTLTWTGLQTATIPTGTTKLYMRLRLSDRSLIDATDATLDERSIGFGAAATNNVANFASASNGEVEDYQIEIVNTFDYGDLPSSFELDNGNAPLPSLHAPLTGFMIGNLHDVETTPASVTSPNQNNTTGDNAIGLADEDGITEFVSVSRGVAYSLTVPLTVPSTMTTTKYVFGWLDLNGDGRFQLGEAATATTTDTGKTSVILTWTSAQTATITSGTAHIYLRLRLSDINLLDATATTVDERSIGNGATSAASSVNATTIAFGEVEDHQLSVDLYDFGDAPVTYDTNSTPAFVPARQMASSAYTIGQTIDYEQAAQNVAAGADNNGANGDGLDEDGIGAQTITRGAPFTFFTNVNANTASNVIAWIDFNNDGKFQATEAAYATSTATASGYQSVTGQNTVHFWFRGAQTSLIPAGVTNLYARIRLTATAGTDNTGTANIDERSIADGATTGVYTTPSFGEVEDYRFTVGNNLYDFGDAPISYEMDKDGTANPANFKPARNLSTQYLYLGTSYDHEAAPASVTMGADNNGNNGDGSDEDGYIGSLLINPGAINTYNVEVKNYTGANATLYGWIDFNNNGRFEASEASTPATLTPGGYGVTVSFTAAQTALIPTTLGKVYMRIRLVQPESGVTIADDTANTVVDERAIGDGLSTGLYGYVALGEVEDYQLQVVRDYGDVPASYENSNPAFHTNSAVPDLYMGATVDYEIAANSVAAGADNNGANGDGLDEDAFSAPLTITSGSQFTVTVPVSTRTTGTKYLYAWIDFNGDGIFNVNELATTSGNVTAGVASNFNLTWAGTTAAPSVITSGKVYVRFRLSAATLPNTNTGTAIDMRSYSGSNAFGEIEDYQFNVVNNTFDYGDAPSLYSRNQAGANVEPRQSISSVLRLGQTVNIENSAHTVGTGADNNGSNGDGNTDDGITTVMPVYKNTAYYTNVSVFNNSGSAKTLHAWIDFNNNGYFEAANEFVSVSVPTSPVQQTVQLTWTAANTNTIGTGVTDVYMRLRISEGALADAANVLLDERSIGDGLNTGVYGTAFGGEVEDYRLRVSSEYDYGDAPNSYDTSRNSILAPARQSVSSALYIGNTPPDSETAKHTSTTALGDDTAGIDDEDGVIISPMFGTGGYAYSAQVKVYNSTTTAKTLYGWIDFNNNGIFEAAEVAFVANNVPANTNGNISLNWTAAQNVITGNPTQLYMRLRLSEGTLTDLAGVGTVDERALADGLNTGEYAATPIIYNGEVEDHVIPVTTQLDYGDAPVHFEENFIGATIAARHIQSENLMLGSTVDIESAPHSVANAADNNGTNGDGLDEDGIDIPLPTMYSGAEYGVNIRVKNDIASIATVHAWIDLDGNGRFTADEYTSASIPASAGNYISKLTWATPNYTSTANYSYMRVRITNGTLADNTSTSNVDERSIGDGLSTGAFGTASLGEVEDYYLPAVPNRTTTVPCENTDDRLGVMDPLQGLFHSTIVKMRTGNWLVFGATAMPNGTTDQLTPIQITPANGYNYSGVPLFVTGASQFTGAADSYTNSHQYMMVASGGLYVWGPGKVFAGATAFRQVSLPAGVGAANIKMIDAGAGTVIGSFALLTNAGEVWTYSNTVGSNVQGDGNLTTAGWHQVMLNSTTPLTGMKDIRIAGAAAIATDGTTSYTWGDNVYLGDGLSNINKSYATQMTIPTGISLPIKQQDLTNDSSTSYFLRDSAGKVFVLGNNSIGQLGLGNTVDATSWRTVRFINEEPNGIGDETDVTRAIPTVKWISASNHDNSTASGLGGSLFSVITSDKRIYSTGSNGGSKKGVVNATNTALLTAATSGTGTKMLDGDMTFVEAGGHISIAVRQGSDRFGYVGHTVQGSDGCNSCTADPVEYNFSLTPAIGQVCGNKLLDYGDLDDNYNLGAKAEHEVLYSPTDAILKLGALGPDSEDGPLFTITGSGNNAQGDDNNGIDDEDAFTGTLPVKTAGSSYTLNVPLTNNTGTTAYLYGFIDWNFNGIFEPGEAVAQNVSASASQQTIALTWADNPDICTNGSSSVRSFVRLRLTTQLFADDSSTAADERSFIAAQDGEVEDYYVDWTPKTCANVCYKPGLTTGGDIWDTKVGITALSRAGENNADNWPMVRKGGWIALESKAKGFVPNRVAFNGAGNPIGIDAANFVEGMMVYDTTNKCLKIYTSTDNGATFAWYCISNQACPD